MRFIPANTITGPVKIGGAIVFTDTGTVTPAAIGSNTDDYNPTEGAKTIDDAVLLRLSTSGNYVITGLIAPVNYRGQIIYLVNVGSNNLTLNDDDASSLAANRFFIGANKTLQSDEGITIVYDTVNQKWRGFGINI